VDLLLTDVMMPGMTGVELVRQLSTKREDLRVLYVSGYLDPMAEASSLDHLAKPFTRAELAARVRASLDR
jgi:DNA-binding response OmpR family regulator